MTYSKNKSKKEFRITISIRGLYFKRVELFYPILPQKTFLFESKYDFLGVCRPF
eukprot:UN03335